MKSARPLKPGECPTFRDDKVRKLFLRAKAGEITLTEAGSVLVEHQVPLDRIGDIFEDVYYGWDYKIMRYGLAWSIIMLVVTTFCVFHRLWPL